VYIGLQWIFINPLLFMFSFLYEFYESDLIKTVVLFTLPWLSFTLNYKKLYERP